MTDDGSAQSSTVWPLPKFHFAVDFGLGEPVPFQEVTGLDVEPQEIAYRHGGAVSPIKMPGLKTSHAVTLRKGIFARDGAFLAWEREMRMITIQRRTVTIDLIDESGASVMRWALSNAWPTKITGTDMKSDGNEIAIDTIELACESITVTHPSQ